MSQLIKLSIVLILITMANLLLKTAKAEVAWEEAFWEDVNNLEHNTTVLLVDVRLPSELEQKGLIPGAINIPVNDVSNALALSQQEFLAKYKREKPQNDTPLVFYCAIGKRSATASEVALDMGFTNVKNYKGSWKDWEEHISQTAVPLQN